jgi:hypothetical protein
MEYSSRFSGLTDVNGIMVYENDIVARCFGAEYNNKKGLLEYKKCGCIDKVICGYASTHFLGFKTIPVIEGQHDPKIACGHLYQKVEIK